MVSVAGFQPYNDVQDKEFYVKPVQVRVLCLETYTVHYVTQKGGYTCAHYSDRKVWSVEDLLRAGFVELPWDGVCVLSNPSCYTRI